MTADTEGTRSLYSSSDVATLLKIQESTLRKYCIMFEKAGYKFHKNENSHRGFFDKDVIVLKKLIETKKHPDMTLEQACNAVMAWIKETGGTEYDTSIITPKDRHNTSDVSSESFEELKKEFQEYKKQQEEFQKELISQLQKQSEYINKTLEERDRKLMNAIQTSMDERKQIAAALEEQEKNKEKKKWYQFW